MGTIAEKLTYLNNSKIAIGDAIEEMGGSVAGASFREYADRVRSIGGGTVNVVGAGDDRISLMKPEKGEWSEIILTEDVETDKYFGFSVGSLPENASSAAWLKIGSDVIATNGIQALTISAGVSLVILHNQSYNDYHEAVSDVDGYYFYLIGDGDAVLTYLQSAQSTDPDFMKWYEDDGSGGLGDLVMVSAAFYNSSEYLVNQFYEQVQTNYGYYINRADVKFGTGETGILLDDLDNITYRLNGLAFNGREAWNYTGESAPNRYAALVDENDNPIADLVIWDGKNWDNDVYSASELGEGWIDAADGSVIILFTGGTNGGDLNKLFDFYFEQRKTTNDITRYELHTPRVVNYNDGLNTYAVTQYSNKGYLLGLPASDATEELNSDTHIVGTVEIYNPTGSTTRVKAEFTYPSGKSYMQAIIPRTYGYLYVRLYDNFVTSPHEVENAVDYVEFTAAAGKNTVIAFLHETDSYADDVVYLEDLEDFISYKNKIAVIINIPSQTNVINSQLGEKTITENGTYAAVDDDVKGYSAVTVNVPSSEPTLVEKTITENGEYLASAESPAADGFSKVTVNVDIPSGWQPDPLWTNIRDLYDNDPLADSYTYRAIYLIAGAEEVTNFVAGGNYKPRRYITSDGYDSGETLLTTTYYHTWNLSQDIIDSKGARMRWLKIYANEEGPVWNFNHSIIWAIHNITTSIPGNSSQYATDFNHCYALQRLEIESTVTSIGNYSLYICPSLQSVIIPSSITSIGNNAFQNCYSLQTAVIPSSVTSIGTSAFSGCRSLVSLTIPTSATTIASDAFASCYSLQNVILGENFDTNLTINAGNTNAASTNLSRQAINAMIAAYKDNSGEGGTARTLTIGATNLAKLTAEDIAVATAKNLTLA